MRKTLFLLLAGLMAFVVVPAQAFEYFERTVLPQVVDGPYDIITADMDNDGDQDFVAVSYYDDDVYLYVNTGGHFGRHTIDASFDGGQKLQVADLDGDGDLDVLGIPWLAPIGVYFLRDFHSIVANGGYQY